MLKGWSILAISIRISLTHLINFHTQPLLASFIFILSRSFNQDFLTYNIIPMKTHKLIPTLLLMFIIIGFSACKKNDSTQKSSTLSVKVVAKVLAVKGGALSIKTADVNIANLQIEENSGNDGQNVGGGDNESGGKDAEGGNENNNGDIILAGPYSLDIASGSASIGQVSIYPGTFKKVDLNFQTSSSSTYNGNSIFITGTYTDNSGTIIPFKIYSSFTQQVQLPLAGNGITVAANSSVTIDIVFDVNAWLTGLNFSSATITNGEIVINSTNNTTLLTIFESNLSKYIDAEKE